MVKALLYGGIGWDIQAKAVNEWLEEHKNESVELHINSPGGDVFEAIAMRMGILSHNDITIVVDAMAASAAAIISLCGKPLKMAEYSRLMLHSASTYAQGNKKQIEKEIEMLESIDKDLASAIAGKMGKTTEEIYDEYFDGNDHWLTAEECVAMGLCEPYNEPKKDGATDSAHTFFNCIFGMENLNNNHKTEKEMDLTKFKAVSAFSECDSEESVLNASVKLVEDLATANNTISENEKQISEKDAKIAELENKLAEFEAEKQKAQDEADEKVITDAVEAKKMTDAQAEIFRAMLKTDRENTLKMIDTLEAPKVEKVTDFIEGGNNGGEKKSYFDEEMERIANKNK